MDDIENLKRFTNLELRQKRWETHVAGELAELREKVAGIDKSLDANAVIVARLIGATFGMLWSLPRFIAKVALEVVIWLTGWERTDERLMQMAKAISAEWAIHQALILSKIEKMETDIAVDWDALEAEVFGDGPLTPDGESE